MSTIDLKHTYTFQMLDQSSWRISRAVKFLQPLGGRTRRMASSYGASRGGIATSSRIARGEDLVSTENAGRFMSGPRAFLWNQGKAYARSALLKLSIAYFALGANGYFLVSPQWSQTGYGGITIHWQISRARKTWSSLTGCSVYKVEGLKRLQAPADNL
jgi:hypothetical protein